jgi:hypothetical protein
MKVVSEAEELASQKRETGLTPVLIACFTENLAILI